MMLSLRLVDGGKAFERAIDDMTTGGDGQRACEADECVCGH